MKDGGAWNWNAVEAMQLCLAPKARVYSTWGNARMALS